MKWVKLSVRVLLVILFLFSAITKLSDLDKFEVYVYQQGFFEFSWASWLSRLIISAELILALGLLLRSYYKIIWGSSVLIICAFSTYLLYQMVAGSSDNCYCFGEFISMSPGESLIKNMVLLILLFLVRDVQPAARKLQKILFFVFSVLALIAPPILSPPDMLLPGRIPQSEVDQMAFQSAIDSNFLPGDYLEGKKIVCFYSVRCQYCHMASSRISAFFRMNDIPLEHLRIAVAGEGEHKVREFYEETKAVDADFTMLNKDSFLQITKGRMPLILLVDDGQIMESWNYRQINDQELLKFLDIN